MEISKFIVTYDFFLWITTVLFSCFHFIFCFFFLSFLSWKGFFFNFCISKIQTKEFCKKLLFCFTEIFTFQIDLSKIANKRNFLNLSYITICTRTCLKSKGIIFSTRINFWCLVGKRQNRTHKKNSLTNAVCCGKGKFYVDVFGVIF